MPEALSPASDRAELSSAITLNTAASPETAIVPVTSTLSVEVPPHCLCKATKNPTDEAIVDRAEKHTAIIFEFK